MIKLSKGFYLTSIIGVFTFGAIVAIVGIIFPEPFGLVPIFIGIICYIYSFAVWNMLIYRMWQSIQGGYARTSPALAVGFLFVPYYNLYWIFQAVWSFTKDCNRYIDRHQIAAPKLSEKLSLVFCIVALFWLCGLPIIGLIIDIFPAIGEWGPSRFCIMSFFLLCFCGLPSIELVIGAFMINRTCDTINQFPQMETVKPKRRPELIGNNKSLHNYLSRQRIRKVYPIVLFNVLLGIGFLIVISSRFISETSTSCSTAFILAFVQSIINFSAIAFLVFAYFDFIGWWTILVGTVLMLFLLLSTDYPTNPAFYIPVWLVYGISLIFLNIQFAKFKRLANGRIDEIEQETPPNTELILEKGVLQQIILWQNEHAVATLRPVLSMEGGSALLWYLAGVAFANMKMYSEALSAFDKAMEASPDAKIISQIRRSQRTVQRSMR